MKAFNVAVTLFVLTLYAIAQQTPDRGPHADDNAMAANNHGHNHTHEDEYGASISFAELKKTVDQLDRVRQATAKYKNVKVAEADGYEGQGEELKGMGVHFVREMEPASFDLEKPPMLVYEKSPTSPDSFNLVGVVYLMKGDEGPDGQPVNNPFPKPLAIWHKHSNVCQLSKRDHVTKLSEEECKRRGGHFNTEWMIHAWIWKDSPRGVFSPKNPLVATTGGDIEIHDK